MEDWHQKENPFESKDYFKEADIVVLAEDVGHGKHTETILSFLDQFGPQLRGLLIEKSIDLQKSIDNYIQMGEVDAHLENLFKGALKEGKDLREETLVILDKAKELGISVICFDAAKKQSAVHNKRNDRGYWFIRGESRDDDMFENVKEQYESSNGKYVVVIGAGHTSQEASGRNQENFGQKMKEEFDDKCLVIRMAGVDRIKSESTGIYDDVVVG